MRGGCKGGQGFVSLGVGIRTSSSSARPRGVLKGAMCPHSVTAVASSLSRKPSRRDSPATKPDEKHRSGKTEDGGGRTEVIDLTEFD